MSTMMTRITQLEAKVAYQSKEMDEKVSTMFSVEIIAFHYLNLNPIALRIARTLWSFVHFECNRVKA